MSYHSTDEARYRKVFRFNMFLLFIVVAGMSISLILYGGAIASKVLS